MFLAGWLRAVAVFALLCDFPQEPRDPSRSSSIDSPEARSPARSSCF
jgi:hypothetical protein